MKLRLILSLLFVLTCALLTMLPEGSIALLLILVELSL